MITAGDFKRGVVVDIGGELFQVVEYAHSKVAQRANMVRFKLKSLKDGRVQERSVPSSEKFSRAQLEPSEVQYLYHDGGIYYFMDTKTFEQMQLDKDLLGDAVSYLKEGETIQLVSYKGQPVGVDLPTTVTLKVKQTAPGFKGDTATAGTKPATVETGLVVKVPLYVSEGDTIKVDTRDGSFVERVS